MRRTFGAWIWLAGFVGLAATVAALTVTGHLNLQTRLTALLPKAERSPAMSRAVEQLADTGERRLVVLVRASTRKQRQNAAAAAAQALEKSAAFTDIVLDRSDLLPADKLASIKKLYFGHRFHLLAPADLSALAKLANQAPADDAKARKHFISRARRRLATPGLGGAHHFLYDPLGLSRTYLQHTLASTVPGITTTANGRLTTTGPDGQRYAVVLARSEGDPFSMASQANAGAAIEHVRNAAHRASPHAQLVISGAIRHAAAASARARFQVTVIGLGSILGVTALMLWLFASLRPLILSLFIIIGGVFNAVVATRLIFGNIHVFTLVFGASLVGVAVDYCLHFLAERWHTTTPGATLRSILPGITLGLITSAAAYGGMAIAPFPALRQIAVFTVSGLCGAWLGVVLLLPALAGPAPRRGRALRLADAWLERGPAALARHWPRATLAAIAGIIVVSAGYTAFGLNPDDGLSTLYNPPTRLVQADKHVARVLGASITSQAILIRGRSPEQTLRREQSIVRQLTRGSPPIARVRAITGAYVPPATQTQTYGRLARTLYADGGPVAQILDRIGYPERLITHQHRKFLAHRRHVLELSTWLASPAGRAYKDLWLGSLGHGDATLIRLQRVNDKAQLKAIIKNTAKTELIDRPARISALLQHYRWMTTWLLGGAYVFAWLLLTIFLGVRRAALVVIAPLTASLLVAALFALTGWPFTIFNVMALLLLLGLGADYGIFLRFADSKSAATMTAVGASAVTTVLAFGLLAASATPALHQFGVTLGLGVVLTFLMASLCSALLRGHPPTNGLKQRQINDD